MMLRCYSELLQLPTFKERYEYLRLDGVVGEETFGFDRYLNQIFYNSQEWKDIRRKIIITVRWGTASVPDRTCR